MRPCLRERDGVSWQRMAAVQNRRIVTVGAAVQHTGWLEGGGSGGFYTFYRNLFFLSSSCFDFLLTPLFPPNSAFFWRLTFLLPHKQSLEEWSTRLLFYLFSLCLQGLFLKESEMK